MKVLQINLSQPHTILRPKKQSPHKRYQTLYNNMRPPVSPTIATRRHLQTHFTHSKIQHLEYTVLQAPLPNIHQSEESLCREDCSVYNNPDSQQDITQPIETISCDMGWEISQMTHALIVVGTHTT